MKLNINEMLSFFRCKFLLLMAVSFYLGCLVSFLYLTSDAQSLDSSIKQSKNVDKTSLLVLILSSPGNAVRRDAIRDTWLNLHGKRDIMKRHFFVIATSGLDYRVLSSIKNENDKYDDILILDKLKDDYRNLTKKVLLSFKWAIENIDDLRYVLKCDDDTFVRLDLLPSEFDKIENSKIDTNFVQPQFSILTNSYYRNNIYWGYFYGNAKVYKTGRWSEPSWFLCDRYLPYAQGGGYVLSYNIVKHIAANSDILRKYNSEDVSVGAWTAGFDINRIHDKRFDTQWTSRGCDEKHLLRHKQSTDDMYEAYAILLKTDFARMCSDEKEPLKRLPYSYNWSVLPSQCCVP